MAPSSSNMRCTAPPVQQHDRAGLRRAQVLKQALGGGGGRCVWGEGGGDRTRTWQGAPRHKLRLQALCNLCALSLAAAQCVHATQGGPPPAPAHTPGSPARAWARGSSGTSSRAAPPCQTRRGGCPTSGRAAGSGGWPGGQGVGARAVRCCGVRAAAQGAGGRSPNERLGMAAGGAQVATPAARSRAPCSGAPGRRRPQPARPCRSAPARPRCAPPRGTARRGRTPAQH